VVTTGNGVHKHILLPLAPEYIGYADAGIDADLFHAVQPDISFTGAHEFKYRIDFDAVEVTGGNRRDLRCPDQPIPPAT